MSQQTLLSPTHFSDFYQQAILATQTGFLVALGIHQRFSLTHGTPADIGHLAQTWLQQAESAGVSNPVLLGSIPFEPGEPSQFMIPQHYDRVSAEALKTSLRGSQLDAHSLQVTDHRFVPDEQGYQAAVSAALAAFDDGSLEKVVLGKQLAMQLDRPVDIARVLLTLLENNPRGYLFSLPLLDDVLFGMSPELLIRRDGTRLLTNPLAGSLHRSADQAEIPRQIEALMQSAKDRHEHQVVVDDIVRHLTPLCSNLHVPAAPSVLQTDSMLHLSTEIAGELADPACSVLRAAMSLHPTPAVCGYPLATAREFIAQHERLPRQAFAGLVGWCDAQGQGEWYIAIRCGRTNAHQLRLFAGAGIVAGSDPELEWQETHAKMTTMLHACGLSHAQLQPEVTLCR